MATAVIIFLLSVVVAILSVLTVLVFRRARIQSRDIEPAVAKAWKDSGLDQRLGQMTAYAKEIHETHRSVEQMLRVPKERASMGELSLETILSDQLPPDMFGMREKVLDGKIPDAHIKSTVGLICIDSKFPLDNYRSMVESTETNGNGEYERRFHRDVRGHLKKIAEDYVCPEQGSAEFAFAYIPSEGVYYFLLNKQYDLLREYTKKGVQVVSPLTLSHKVELIKTGVHALKLSQEAEKVRTDLARLSRQFDAVDQEWRVFYRTHLKNAVGKAEDLDVAYSKLRNEFSRVSNFASESESARVA